MEKSRLQETLPGTSTRHQALKSLKQDRMEIDATEAKCEPQEVQDPDYEM